MNRDQARRFLCGPRWVRVLFRRRALQFLVEDPHPDSIDILVDGMLSSGAFWLDRIREALIGVREQPRIDRLWQIWAESRRQELGSILKEIGRESEAEELRELAILKLGREREMPTDHDFAASLVTYLDDADMDVRAAVRRYVENLRSKHTKSFFMFSLTAGEFGRIGTEREDIDRVLAYRDDDTLAKKVENYRKSLPPRASIYWDLRLNQLGKISINPKSPWDLAAFLSDADDEIRERAETVRAELRRAEPEAWLLLKVKMQEQDDLPVNPRTVRTVMQWFEHEDKDVRQAVAAYLERLPNDELRNEVLFSVWLKTDSDRFKETLVASNRMPPSPAVEALYYLLNGDSKRYLEMEDTNGELFHEAWLVAREEQRKRINQTVVESHNEQLIQSYEQALACRNDYDLDLHISALSSAGLDDKLFELLDQMNLPQALAGIRRWTENGWRPDGKRERELLDEVTSLYRTLPEAVDAPHPSPIAGTESLLERWRDEADPDADDPLSRAHRTFFEQVNEPDDPHWLVRFAASFHAPPLASSKEDHVLWANANRCCFDVLKESQVRCTPEVAAATSDLLDRVRETPGPTATRLRIVLQILRTLQHHYCTDIELIDDDHPAVANAIEVEEVSLDEFEAMSCQ